MHRMLLTSLIGFLLSSCAAGTGGYYAPRIRDVSEEAIDGNPGYQKLTLYDPVSSMMDCPISRNGQKLDLDSPAELAENWRKYWRNTMNNESGSDGM